jgi:hypothetical protein
MRPWGRSFVENSRPQPYALRACANRSKSPAAARRPESPLASGQDVVAKWRAPSSARRPQGLPTRLRAPTAPVANG